MNNEWINEALKDDKDVEAVISLDEELIAEREDILELIGLVDEGL